MKFTFQEMTEALEGMAYSKASWLSDFGAGKKKRSDHEIQNKQRELAVLRQAIGDYRRAAERKAA